MSKKHKKHSPSSGEHDDHDDHEEGHGSHAHGEHEEGEPWLVSYADMMTLLFGFFVVMYSFAARDPKVQECISLTLMEAFKDQKPETSDDLKGATMQGAAVRAMQMLVTLMNLDSVEDLMEKVQKETEKAETAGKEGAETASESEKKEAGKELKDSKDLEALKAMLTSDENTNVVSIEIPADVLFDTGSAKLNRQSEVRIHEIAALLNTYSEILDVEVAGHSDSAPTRPGAPIDSWTLSVMRASSVANVLKASGLPENILKVAGRGSTAPLLPEKTLNGQWIQENMKRNRRIEISFRREKTSVVKNQKN